MENRKRFLDELWLKFNIQHPHDWGKITARDIDENGGRTILHHYYNGSLYACLQSVYKGSKFILVTNRY